MSSRLPTRWSSRSAPSSMPSSSSAWSSSDHATSSERREETAALMLKASGVRRSWLTAARRAVRMRLPSASARAWSASSRRRLRSRTTAAWAAKAARTRRSEAGRTRPVSARAMWSPTGMSTSPSSGRSSGAPTPTRPGAGPGLHVALALQQGDGLHAEGLPDPFQERFEAGLAAQHAAREEGQDLGLGAQSGGLLGASRGEVDHGGHGHGDPDEDRDGDDVLGVGDRQPVQRGRVVVVQQERSDGRRHQRGSQPAEQRRRHRQRQEQQHVVGEPEVDRVQQEREPHRAHHADQPPGDDPAPPEPRAPGHGQSAPLGDLFVGDDVDVQVGPGLAGDRGAHPRPEDVLPGLAARGAEDDLRGVDPAREVEQRGRDVVADDVVESAAEVLGEGALEGEFLRGCGGQAVAAGDVDGQHLAASPPSRRAARPAVSASALRGRRSVLRRSARANPRSPRPRARCGTPGGTRRPGRPPTGAPTPAGR